MTLERKLQEHIFRYARAVDRLDSEGIARSFHSDAQLELGALKTTGEHAPEVIVGALTQGCERSVHFVSNVIVDLGPGEAQARAESYVRAVQLLRRDGRLYNRELICRWLDRFEQRDKIWAIAARLAVYEWSRIDEIDEEMVGADAWAQGSRSKADPIYAFLGVDHS